MLLTDRSPPPPAPGWLYELKHDGYRVLARGHGGDGGEVQLRTRNVADCTRWYPEVARGTLAARHILDGEACVLDDIGRPDFNWLQDRSRRRGWRPSADLVTFMAVDLPVYRGRDIRGWAVERRKAALEALLTPAPDSVLYVGHVEHGGTEL